ncbi:MAG: hypothetical protein ACYCT2_04690 [Thermoplasmataceae archaeon]
MGSKKNSKSLGGRRFLILLVIGLLIPLAFALVTDLVKPGLYLFFELADGGMSISVMLSTFFTRKNLANGTKMQLPTKTLFLAGLFSLVVFFVVMFLVKEISNKLWIGILGFLSAFFLLLVMILMSYNYEVEKDEKGTVRVLGDTNLIFIFLAIIPLLATATTYVGVKESGNSWAISMIPSLLGFVLGGLAVIVGIIVKTERNEIIGLVAGLLIFIVGYLFFVFSLPFIESVQSTAKYLGFFEIVSPLYLYSFLSISMFGEGTVISKVLGFCTKNGD